ncbi:hypothetical protein NECAME_17940 [Necator americanus]|uniref:SCP domain-containing protein n=1 Tax=Necator americanus TaxID=51031 RepID=W2TGW6_NECAM|nr:hypothetical protein NECAME_17940 [Necator americanus]ETN81088.1 hypothetical protein NECAME_17940 [Necator americanus]
MPKTIHRREWSLQAFSFSCSNAGLSDSLRQVFLSYHNDARLRVAKGVEPNNVGTLNPAKNMYKLNRTAYYFV